MRVVQVVDKCQRRSFNRCRGVDLLRINRDLNKHTGSRTVKSWVRSTNTKMMTARMNTFNNNSNSNSNSCTQCRSNF
jgi:hypothetical protein